MNIEVKCFCENSPKKNFRGGGGGGSGSGWVRVNVKEESKFL